MKKQQELFNWSEYTCIITGGKIPEVQKDKKKSYAWMKLYYQENKKKKEVEIASAKR